MPRLALRIRLLGELDVTRPDGTHVDIRAWRTGKTVDLLRLLALEDGHPVRLARLVDTLWPDATWDRGRGSLRTAASQIRRVTGADCVLRSTEGMSLVDAWVDIPELIRISDEVHAIVRLGDHGRVLALARRAESLHRGEFHAYDDEAGWARTERERIRRARARLLNDASASALAMGYGDEAVDFATTSVELDPASESAHRALMTAYAELGETTSALRVFEAYRAHLAEELGADPSPQTQELHLSLLRGRGWRSAT